MTAPIAIAAGGTGGHMFPALATCRELLQRGRQVALMTDRRGRALVSSMAGLEGLAIHRLTAAPLAGRNLVARATAAARLVQGAFEARGLLKRLDPAVAVGFGGYPTAAPLLAAQQLGIATAVHEQNALLGRANRLLAWRARLVATSFAATAGAPAARAFFTGNPVREAIAAVGAGGYAPCGQEACFHLLVFGGSQGARVLGETVPQALRALPPTLRRRLEVVQQCRPEDVGRVRAAFAALGVAATVAAFFDDMERRLARAHLAVARAGASTVAELAAARRPAILVPYPHAADDHQSANARAFREAGAGWLLPQPSLSAAGLARRLEMLIASPAILEAAAAAAGRMARPDAVRRLADAIESLAALAVRGARRSAPRRQWPSNGVRPAAPRDPRKPHMREEAA